VRPKRLRSPRSEWALAAIEASALSGAALVGMIAALGQLSSWFVGAGMWSHLLPFAAGVLALAIATGAAIGSWLAARRPIGQRLRWAPAALASLVAVGSGWFALQPAFERNVRELQSLIGGQAAAERAAIAHQVYAAYRRASLVHWQHLFERARRYQPIVEEAAAAFNLDPALVMGVAAAESAFQPRRSTDGGRGLFQITAPPAAASQAARRALQLDRLDLADDRHNAFVGAATLRTYLDQMRDDLFLGLLAYNIGPANGGLQAIMQHYGARDFVTIQPYLQQLPRDYPIRVLSAALAYRLWQRDGQLRRYEERDNAEQIQAVGIPGLD
jgi:soluble lytic murein transglycosylase-like protein